MDPGIVKAWQNIALQQEEIDLLRLLAKVSEAGAPMFRDNLDRANKFEKHLKALKSLVGQNVTDRVTLVIRQGGDPYVPLRGYFP